MLITYFIGNVVLVIGLCFGLLLNIFDVVAANPRLAREYDQAEMEHQIKDSMIERYGLMTMIALGEICMRQLIAESLVIQLFALSSVLF